MTAESENVLDTLWHSEDDLESFFNTTIMGAQKHVDDYNRTLLKNFTEEWAYVAIDGGIFFRIEQDMPMYKRSVETLRQFYAHTPTLVISELTKGANGACLAYCKKRENLVDEWLSWRGSACRKFLSQWDFDQCVDECFFPVTLGFRSVCG